MKKGTFASLVVAILLSGAVAGCLSDDTSTTKRAGTKNLGGAPPKIWAIADPILSQPIFEKILFEALPLTASDGTNLDSWMFRPETPDDVKIPAILHLSPYYGASLPLGGGGMLRMMNENFTARGYAVIGHSVRGTGFSGGCFEIGGPRERQDVVELLDHIANQSWSNGLVGLIGVSYDGTAPQGALIMSNPHLKTIVPIAAISEWHKYNFINGVQINPQGYAFNTYYVGDEGAPNLHGLPHEGPLSPGVPTRPPRMEEIQMWPEDGEVIASRVCPNQGSNNGAFRGGSLIDPQRAQVATAFTGTTDPYWEERNFTRHIENIRPNVSVFVVHGLIDYNVKTHNLLPWYNELKEFGVPTKILLGQWPHAYPGTVRPSGRADWNLTLLRWFDYWLKGIDTGIMSEPEADIQDFEGVWRTEETWPPTRAVNRTFYLDASGQLKDAPGTGQSMFLDNGQAPTPTAPVNPSSATFLGPVLTEPFRYSGQALATLTLSHSAPTGHVAVTVYNVTGNVWQPVNWGFFNYNIKDDPAVFTPLSPNQPFTLHFGLLPTDMVITTGSRLAVVLSATSTGGPSMLPPPSGGLTTVIHGEDSHVTFPTIDGIAPLCPQPKMTGRDPNPVC
jgi:X-Pro dipeptidyl-peptidase